MLFCERLVVDLLLVAVIGYVIKICAPNLESLIFCICIDCNAKD